MQIPSYNFKKSTYESHQDQNLHHLAQCRHMVWAPSKVALIGQPVRVSSTPYMSVACSIQMYAVTDTARGEEMPALLDIVSHPPRTDTCSHCGDQRPLGNQCCGLCCFEEICSDAQMPSLLERLASFDTISCDTQKALQEH